MADAARIRTLTDLAKGVWLDEFMLTAGEMGHAGGWSVRKRTLRGGPADGIDLIEVDNGALSFSVLPTRGMGLWRGRYRGVSLGWDAPLAGPVHPKFVDLDGDNGLGFLTGFDELMCRCGLAWNGPPGDDHGKPLTLHGRIANRPAHRVEVAVDPDPPHTIHVTGVVQEGGLFLGSLWLSTVYETVPGSNRLTVYDEVFNAGGTPAEAQVLYHVNFGPPLLGEGARILAPFREVAPLTHRAAEGIDGFTDYGPPTPGYAEQVYACRMHETDGGWTLALLQAPGADRAAVLRWRPAELPCFTIWKNTAALQDGYVTGLEPATNFPNFRAFERQHGRVVTLPPNGKWSCTWSIDVFDSMDSVSGVRDEIAAVQRAEAVVHRTPQASFSPVK